MGVGSWELGDGMDGGTTGVADLGDGFLFS
jgi:hypothetical protein